MEILNEIKFAMDDGGLGMGTEDTSGGADMGDGTSIDNPQPEPDFAPFTSQFSDKYKKHEDLKGLKKLDDFMEKYLSTKEEAGKSKMQYKAGMDGDELSEYRKANGIPDTPDGYGIDNKEIATFMHSINATPEQAKQAAAAAKAASSQQAEQMKKQTAAQRANLAEFLQEKFDEDYDVKKARLDNFVTSHVPPKVREKLVKAGLAADTDLYGFFIKMSDRLGENKRIRERDARIAEENEDFHY